MNKTLLSAALVVGFGVAAFAPQTAHAVDGTITISGRITSATCTVAVNGSASPTVVLPTVQTTAFGVSGTTAGFVPVKFTLSNCTAGADVTPSTTVIPYFEPGPNIAANGYLNNSGGTATGVAVVLSKDSTTAGKVDLSKGPGLQGAGTAVALTGTPTFTYYAGYVSTLAAVTAGSVNTSVQYSLSYN